MAQRITFTDKIGVIVKKIRTNQWWDSDANQVKQVVNSHADDIESISQKLRPIIIVNGNPFYLVKNPDNNNILNINVLEANDFIISGAWSSTEWWDKAIALGTDKDNRENWKPLSPVKEIPLI